MWEIGGFPVSLFDRVLICRQLVKCVLDSWWETLPHWQFFQAEGQSWVERASARITWACMIFLLKLSGKLLGRSLFDVNSWERERETRRVHSTWWHSLPTRMFVVKKTWKRDCWSSLFSRCFLIRRERERVWQTRLSGIWVMMMMGFLLEKSCHPFLVCHLIWETPTKCGTFCLGGFDLLWGFCGHCVVWKKEK